MNEQRMIDYANYCNRYGKTEKAIKLFSKINDEQYICHAAEIAVRIEKYSLARHLIKKAKKLIELEREFVESKHNEGMPGLGTLMCYGLDKFAIEERTTKIEGLEKRLNELTRGAS